MKIKVSQIMLLCLLLSCNNSQKDNKIGAIANLPDFDLISVDSTKHLKSSDIKGGETSLLIYFNPECDHCQRETKSILMHMSRFKKTGLYWVSNEISPSLKKFYDTFRLDTVRNAFVGQDYNYSFYRAFLPSDVPYIAVYDRNNKLIKIYKGETDITSLLYSVGL